MAGASEGFERKFILHAPRELIGLGRVFGEFAHQRAALIGIFQPIEEHMIVDRIVTQPITPARLLQKIGRIGHALHTTGNDDIRAACMDGAHGRCA